MSEMRKIDPKISYFGTPVAIVSSSMRMATRIWLPYRHSGLWAGPCLDETKTAENLNRFAECVVNLPSPEMWKSVEKPAPLTGKNPVPEIKADQFRFECDKKIAGLCRGCGPPLLRNHGTKEGKYY